MKIPMLFYFVVWQILSKISNAQPFGFRYQPSQYSLDESVSALEEYLDTLPPVHVLDSLNLGDTTDFQVWLVLFANPLLGTILMQENQMVALELPMRILIWRDNVDVWVGYLDPVDYLKPRYGLQTVDDTLMTMSDAIANFARIAAGNADDSLVITTDNTALQSGEGVTVFGSLYSFDETRDELSAKPNIDGSEGFYGHYSNAEGVGLELRPTVSLVIKMEGAENQLYSQNPMIALQFGNLGVWEDLNGDVWIAYNDVNFLADLYGLSDVVSEDIKEIVSRYENFTSGVIVVDNENEGETEHEESGQESGVLSNQFTTLFYIVPFAATMC